MDTKQLHTIIEAGKSHRAASPALSKQEYNPPLPIAKTDVLTR